MAKIGNLHEVGSWKLEVFQEQTFLYFFTFRHAFRTRFLIFRQSSILKKIKRAQTMLQSWLIFTGSLSFHFSKLPRQNFRRKFCHPFKEGESFTFLTLKTIAARFARAKK